MGIDLYIDRKTETKDDEIDHFSTNQGHVGYLREAYHGYPYATRLLAPEAFESPDQRAKIPARKLRARLTKKMPTKQIEGIDGGDLCARLMKFMHKNNVIEDVLEKCVSAKNDEENAEQQTNVSTVSFDDILKTSGNSEEIRNCVVSATEEQLEARDNLPEELSVLDAVALRYAKIYDATNEHIREVQQSFMDFVELAERLEEENGEPCTIFASF